jgi:hypothetical protein
MIHVLSIWLLVAAFFGAGVFNAIGTPRDARKLPPVGLPKLVAPGHRWIGNIERHSDCASAWTRCRSGSRDDNHRRRIADRAASPRIFGSPSA